MSKLVVLRRCATIEEALIVRSLLQDGGFYAHIGEYHISHMQWDAIAAFGGVTVWVRHPRLLEAGTYLMEMRASADQRLKSELGDYDNAPLKIRWGRALSMILIQMGSSTLMAAFLAFLFALSPRDW